MTNIVKFTPRADSPYGSRVNVTMEFLYDALIILRGRSLSSVPDLFSPPEFQEYDDVPVEYDVRVD